jgi:hypothetical protein
VATRRAYVVPKILGIPEASTGTRVQRDDTPHSEPLVASTSLRHLGRLMTDASGPRRCS